MFWSAFWGLKSAAFSDFESFVIMSKFVAIVDHPYFEVFVGMSIMQGTPTYPAIIMFKA